MNHRHLIRVATLGLAGMAGFGVHAANAPSALPHCPPVVVPDYPVQCDVPLGNPGFDTGDLPPWQPTLVKDGAGEMVPTHPRIAWVDGQPALELPAYFDGAKQDIELPDLSATGNNNSSLVVRFRARATAHLEQGLMLALFRDAEDSEGIFLDTEKLAVDSGWTEYTVTIKPTPLPDHRRLSLQLINIANDEPVRVFVDDVSLTQDIGTPPTN